MKLDLPHHDGTNVAVVEDTQSGRNTIGMPSIGIGMPP